MQRMLELFILAGFFVGNPAPGAEGTPSGETKAPQQKTTGELARELDALKARYDKELKALRKELEELRAQSGPGEEEELKALIQSAEEEANRAEPEEKLEEKTFKIGGLSLQALNPEISVVGDMVTSFEYQGRTTKRADFDFRVLDIHIQSYLDPYSKLKAAMPVISHNSRSSSWRTWSAPWVSMPPMRNWGRSGWSSRNPA